jgi:transglutaminase-like putative cysteine protease
MQIFFLVCMAFLMVAGAATAQQAKFRVVDFQYEVILKDIPKNAKTVTLWIPILPDNQFQKINQISISPGNFAAITSDQTYQNKILSFSLQPPFDAYSSIIIDYQIKRFEHANQPGISLDTPALEKKEDLEKYLNTNRLGQLTPEFKQIATQITQEGKTTVEKARAIYNYILNTLSYNKTIPGWGQGDTPRVCLVKAGNCTDFHSLFISMARENGIPGKFIIGVPFNQDIHEGLISGYHCWAEFYDEQQGWVPVDITEAYKNKNKHDYYFGAIDENRVAFSKGRDIVLSPQQETEPVNFFFYPYVNVDGKEFKGIQTRFTFKDL